MGTVTAAKILDRVQQTLIEGLTDGTAGTVGTYWPRVVLFQDLNTAQTQIAGERKDIYPQRGPALLVEGTRQRIDPDAMVLMDITRNLGASGDIDGPAIRQVDKETMDRVAPNWPIDTASSTIIHYMYEPDNPKDYDVWPPVPALGTWVQIIQGMIPPDLTDESQVLYIDDYWANAVYHYILHRAYEKNTTRGDLAKSQLHYTLYRADLGDEAAAKAAVEANPARPK